MIIEKKINSPSGLIIVRMPIIPTIATETDIIIVSSKNIIWQVSFVDLRVMQILTMKEMRVKKATKPKKDSTISIYAITNRGIFNKAMNKFDKLEVQNKARCCYVLTRFILIFFNELCSFYFFIRSPSTILFWL